MDDLTSIISQVLQNPESMNQLRATAQALGLNPDGPPPPGFEAFGGGAPTAGATPAPQTPAPQENKAAMPDLSALSALLGGLGGGGQSSSQAPQMPAIDPATLKLIGGAMTKLNSSDKNIDLLRALKPHFTGGRAGRVDDAIRLLQLFSMLPMLRESGILNRFLGGGDHR